MTEETQEPSLGRRKIIHIDMDAFFAAVEQRDRPELRGRPVIVGGSPEHRGVVSTCSYEARPYGVHSAMPTRSALRLCPNAILLTPDLRKYRAVSEEIRAVFYRYTDLVEAVSIDEAYLDVTECKIPAESATQTARMIQRDIFEATGLTASAGVSYNKFLAKIASDMRKPAGLTVIRPDQAESFLSTLPVEKFHGIGKVTSSKLLSMNIKFGRDLRKLDAGMLISLFGKVGYFYYKIVRGVDERPVETDEDPKSIGHEITMPEDCTNHRQLRIILRALSRKVSRRLVSGGLPGRTVTVKVRYGDFRTVTRSESFNHPILEGGEIGRIAIQLAEKAGLYENPIRLLGVTVSNFFTEEEQNRPVQLEFDFREQ